MQRAFDVIVAGTGGMGVAAAQALATRGHRVLGLDRFPLGHARGSSHGQTRLIRRAYFEHPDYVPLLQRSYELWRELEAATGRRLLVTSGLLTAGPATGDVVSGTLHSARVHGLVVEALTPREAMSRWPAFRLPEPWTAVHEPEAGYLFVEECVAAHASLARAARVELRTGVTVLGWRVDGGRVAVETDQGTCHADRLVLCPGAWAGELLQLPDVPLTVLRKSLFWHAANAAAAAGTMPCFAFETPQGFCYGFPSLDPRGVKIAAHSGGRIVHDPLEVDRGIDAGEQGCITDWVTSYLPAVTHERTNHAVCLYTMSPDGHFLLGRHPDHPQVVLAAGFSGHGYKFASVVGEILADLAVDGRTRHPIGFLAPDRVFA
jgi:sarcosine oxidase